MTLQMDELIPFAVLHVIKETAKKCTSIDNYKPDKFTFNVD